jgi:hypothetical protein
VHGEVRIVPVPLLVIVTVPDGVIAVPASVSVTVAVQFVAALTMTEGGAQTIVVVVVLLATVTVVLPELVAWVVSPA